VIYLLDQFTTYLGHDWHWFRIRKFRQQLHNIYMTTDSSESKDRTWLCQLLVVLALAESVDASRQPEINHDPTDSPLRSAGHGSAQGSIHPPGREYFEQALRLLNVPFENGSVDHVEVLNMIVSPPFIKE
jgi:proline utilization trans-activator